MDAECTHKNTETMTMQTPTVTITLTQEEKVTIIAALINQHIYQTAYASEVKNGADAYMQSAEMAKELAIKLIQKYR